MPSTDGLVGNGVEVPRWRRLPPNKPLHLTGRAMSAAEGSRFPAARPAGERGVRWLGGAPVTVAVCLECGRMKAGAWTPCPACNYQPAGAEELAKALMVSDSCVAPDKLQEFVARRQQGEPWNFSPELVEMFKARVAAILPVGPDGRPAPMEGGPPGGGESPAGAEGGRPARKPWWRFW